MHIKPILQKYNLIEFSIINDFADHQNGNFQIKPNINFTIAASPDQKIFTGDFSIEIGNMDDGSPMYIKVRLKGFFLAVKPQTTEGEAPAEFIPEEFHREAFPQIYNVVRTLIASTMQMGGMKPLILNSIDAARLDVHKNN